MQKVRRKKDETEKREQRKTDKEGDMREWRKKMRWKESRENEIERKNVKLKKREWRRMGDSGDRRKRQSKRTSEFMGGNRKRDRKWEIVDEVMKWKKREREIEEEKDIKWERMKEKYIDRKGSYKRENKKGKTENDKNVKGKKEQKERGQWMTEIGEGNESGKERQ